jgi:acyl-coenzyme A synthetase/AMP-(fatty) acid ligase
VVTVAQSSRGGRVLDLKATVDDAVSRCPTVKRVFVSDEKDTVKLGKKDISLEKVCGVLISRCKYTEIYFDNFIGLRFYL